MKDDKGEAFEKWTFTNGFVEFIYCSVGHELLKVCSLFGFEVLNHEHHRHAMQIIKNKDENGNYHYKPFEE